MENEENGKIVRFIAELSGNHCGNVKLAKLMIEKAKKAGADFVKLQYYKTHMLFRKEHPLYKKVKQAQLSIRKIEELKSYAEEEVKIPLVCTPFISPKLVDDLEKIGLNYYKIREADSQNKDLIDRVLKTGKIVFISTRTFPVDAYYLYHPKIKWLFCLPFYPPKLEQFQINRVGVFDGFSNHFPNIVVPLSAAIMAVSKGKKEYYIEVHVVLTHAMDVVDSAVSLDFGEFETLIKYVRMIEKFGGE